ncbi:MAG TPA: preprotein translocase subunit SecG [Terriglobales bacterium]|nr:preprotein translocase subunit SecG [Terriglobales bacterium]
MSPATLSIVMHLVTIVHVIVCLFLIIVVLLQSGTSGDIAAAFGGQGSQTAFGPRAGATLLTKATAWVTVIFILTSLTLTIYDARKAPGGSVLEKVKPAATQPAPQPSPAPAQSPAPTK